MKGSKEKLNLGIFDSHGKIGKSNNRFCRKMTRKKKQKKIEKKKNQKVTGQKLWSDLIVLLD